jgi:hypothetical protein
VLVSDLGLSTLDVDEGWSFVRRRSAISSWGLAEMGRGWRCVVHVRKSRFVVAHTSGRCEEALATEASRKAHARSQGTAGFLVQRRLANLLQSDHASLPPTSEDRSVRVTTLAHTRRALPVADDQTPQQAQLAVRRRGPRYHRRCCNGAARAGSLRVAQRDAQRPAGVPYTPTARLRQEASPCGMCCSGWRSSSTTGCSRTRSLANRFPWPGDATTDARQG